MFDSFTGSFPIYVFLLHRAMCHQVQVRTVS